MKNAFTHKQEMAIAAARVDVRGVCYWTMQVIFRAAELLIVKNRREAFC
jgi:hypothetical protein